MEYAGILFLVGRILYGGFFVMSGINHFMKKEMMKGYAASKGVRAAGFAVIFTGLMLLAGGLGIILGVYMRLAIAVLIVFLVPVTVTMHNFWTVTDPMAKTGEMVNFMKNMALIGAALMLLALPF